MAAELALRDRLRRQGVTYPLAGAVLAAGAPLGLFAMRRLLLGQRITIREEIRRDFATYAYLTTSTTIAFMLVGAALGRYADRLVQLSTTDALTGLLNPRAFSHRLDQEIARTRRSDSPITLLLLDLDRLKALNDRYGHAIGDRALERIARAIQHEMRSIDVGGRLGGDEFALVCVETDHTAATAIAERLQRTIVSQNQELGVPITASIGVVTLDPPHDSVRSAHDLTRAADVALYRAKRAGGNQFTVGSLHERHAGSCAHTVG